MVDIEFNHLEQNFAHRMTEMCALISQQISFFEEKQHKALYAYNDLVETLLHSSIAYSTTDQFQDEGHIRIEKMQAQESIIVDQFSSLMKSRYELTNQFETNPDSKDELVFLLENTESRFRASIEKWEESIANFEKLIEDIKSCCFEKVCMNCKNPYTHGDKYCRYCGAPMGTPIFILEKHACIYGPMPVTRIHTCTKCGYSWENCLMIDRERWCPKCGGRVIVSGDRLVSITPGSKIIQ